MTDTLPTSSLPESKWQGLSMLWSVRVARLQGHEVSTVFGKRRRERVAYKEESIRIERGKLAGALVELDRRLYIEEMARRALDKVEEANRRAPPE